MMTSETCQGSIPASKTYTQMGYYSPPFRISGTSGLAMPDVYSKQALTDSATINRYAVLGALAVVGLYFFFQMAKKS